jgi:F0F1-type ATP synthase delta subunit
MNAAGYSEAVYKALQSGAKPAAVLANLKEVLSRHGHVALYPRILHAVLAMARKDDAHKTAVVRVARKEDRRKYEKEIEAFLKEHNLMDATVTVDENLIGGYILEGEGMRVDASYKSSLLTIYQNLIA